MRRSPGQIRSSCGRMLTRLGVDHGGLLLNLPLGMLLLLPKLRLLRLPLTLHRCWYPTRQKYLYKTSESEHVSIEGFGAGLWGGNGSSIRATQYRPKRCPPKRCRRHLNRPP